MFIFANMKMYLWTIFLLVSSVLEFAFGFKEGAPVSMCSSMVPQHGVPAQSTSSPYQLTALEAGDGIFRVKLESSSGLDFAGLMLQVRTTTDGPPLGSFSRFSKQLQSINCGNTPNSALTHRNNERKKIIESEWEVSDDFNGGEIQFVSSIVYNYTTFWTGVSSEIIKISKRSNSIPDTTQATPKFQEMYEGCLKRKKCLGFPENCLENKNCEVMVTVNSNNINYTFEMMALKSKYIAVGFSEDNKMGGDSVLECVHESNESGSVKAYRSLNIPNMKQNRRLDVTNDYFLHTGRYTDGDIYCKVSLNSGFESEGQNVDLESTPFYLLLAAGKSLKESSVGFHDVASVASSDKQLLSDLKILKKNDPTYDGCNIEKNCFGYPDGCISRQECEALVTVLVQGTKYIFELKGNSNAYIAMALSKDDKMGSDSVVECTHEQGSRVNIYSSWNKPGEKANTRKKINQEGVNLLNSSFEDGTIYCKFSLETLRTIEGETFDLAKDKFFLLLAAGSSLKEGGVGYHDLLRTASGEQRALSDIGAIESSSKLLLRLHGSFMVAAWIGSASIGIVLARYFKQTWVGSSLCAKDLWFAWHRFFMLLTWSLTIVGFILIFVELEDWVGRGSQIHAILGCVTTLLCFIQPIGAAFRPHPAARNRSTFNWLHWLIGNSAHIFAIITIFFAVPLNKAELPEWLDWILVAFVVLYVFIHVVLSCAGCISESKSGKRINTFPMKDINTSRSALNTVERKQDAPLGSLRKFMLFVHIVGITAITGAVILIVVLAPIDKQWNSLKNKFLPS